MIGLTYIIKNSKVDIGVLKWLRMTICLCACVMCVGSHVILGCRALSAMVKSSDDGQITPKLLRYLQECSHDNQQEIMV